jgi:hypothetical protein
MILAFLAVILVIAAAVGLAYAMWATRARWTTRARSGESAGKSADTWSQSRFRRPRSAGRFHVTWQEVAGVVIAFVIFVAWVIPILDGYHFGCHPLTDNRCATRLGIEFGKYETRREGEGR